MLNTNEIEIKIKNLLLNKNVNYRDTKSGEIVEIESIGSHTKSYIMSDLEAHVSVKIKFEDSTRAMCIYKSNLKTFGLDTEELNNLFDELNEITIKNYHDAEVVEEQRKLEAKAQKEQAAKAEALERKKERDLLKANNYTLSPITDNPEADFYYALGWMAKHVTRVSASMPDYLEAWFKSHFKASDEDIRVVAKDYISPAGWTAQWGLSMSIGFKYKGHAPLIVEQKIKSTKSKTINNVDFVWDLIESYKFSFGRHQDVEKIKSTVPSEYLLDFESGYED